MRWPDRWRTAGRDAASCGVRPRLPVRRWRRRSRSGRGPASIATISAAVARPERGTRATMAWSAAHPPPGCPAALASALCRATAVARAWGLAEVVARRATGATIARPAALAGVATWERAPDRRRDIVEQSQFDRLTRQFAGRQSRRQTLRRLGQSAVAGVLAAVGFREIKASAQILPCAEDGCHCRPGTPNACIPGLVCCADNPDQPGGRGTCVPPSQCFGGLCSGDAVVCPASCAWGTTCAGCCSGFCGHDGLCNQGGCREAGCDCISGTLAPCDEGLVCCPTIAGVLGGPGICLPRGICN